MKKNYFRFLTAAFLLISGVSAADIDFKLYGAGPMVKPGASYYVSSAGSDSNDGKSLKKAWRTLKRGVRDLKAGEKVRCQYMASGYSYGILSGRIPGYEWKTYTCKVSGTDLQGTGDYGKFWPGAKVFQVVIVANYNPKTASEILVKNISVTAE